MKFEAFARSYDLHARPQQIFAERVAQFAGPLRREDILELGAGTGALTAALCAMPGVRVRATDVSPSMVELGRRKVPAAHWELLDAFEEPLPGGDLQISSGLLQWAQNPELTLRAWRHGISPEGRMVHGFPCDPCLCEWRRIMPASPLAWRTSDEWLEVFARAGLHVLRHDQWRIEVTFQSGLEFLRSLHHSGVTGPAQVSGGRLRAALREYESSHRTANGVTATWAWMAVEARRA